MAARQKGYAVFDLGVQANETSKSKSKMLSTRSIKGIIVLDDNNEALPCPWCAGMAMLVAE